MLFNTFEFAVFFIIVFFLYLTLPHRWQNRMLLVASYIFYGSWDAMFLMLLVLSTIWDYFLAIQIEQTQYPRRKKLFLILSVSFSLGILGYFKYFNFFAESLQRLLYRFGISLDMNFAHIVLPVGISFYTFQTMSYVIDVYRGQLKAGRNLLDFALYISFFPQLVAGPIERATRLLPQIVNPRKLNWAQFNEGCYLIFWGLFQKVFIADNLAKIADPTFASSAPYRGLDVVFAVYAFTIQILCDFGGYSDIARGLGKCMGIELMNNFNLPYFATNPRDLWQRWHISLSTWIRDYLFKHLGGYKKGPWLAGRNAIISFFLGGLWHGANWTFVVWGVYHGILLMIYFLMKPWLDAFFEPKNIFLRNFWFLVRVVFFFHLFCLGALVFRAQSLTQAFQMFHSVIFNMDLNWEIFGNYLRNFAFYCWILFVLQCIQFRKNDLLIVLKWPVAVRTIFYYICFYLLLIYGVQGGQQFYYFQF